MPIGDGLKDIIADQLSQIGRHKRENGYIFVTSRGADELLVNAIEVSGQQAGSTAWLTIANGMAEGIRHAPSIDRYLHIHRDDKAKVTIGKLAIAWAILKSEEESLLSNGVILANISREMAGEPHWLNQLFTRLQSDAPLKEIKQAFENLTIITFNYDRLIEHYLFNAVKALGGFDTRQAADAITHLQIVHPYGKIGRLPWQSDGEGPTLSFGKNQDMHYQLLIDSADRLRTFTETVDDEGVITAIRHSITETNQIIVLGFSYLTQNLELMKSDANSKVENIEATYFRESESNRYIAERGLLSMLRGGAKPEFDDYKIRWHNMPAGKFIRDYGNEISS